VVAGELADVVAGLGQDREGAAVIPVDVDGGLGDLPNAGDGAAVTGPQAGGGSSVATSSTRSLGCNAIACS
jgi:hypothetical protein